MGRLVLGTAGLFMLADALISASTSTDRRPGVQAGRALRGAVGVGLGVTALVKRPARDGTAGSFWMGTLSSIVGGVIVAAALTAGGAKAVAT